MGKARAQLWQSARLKQRKLVLLSVIIAEAMFFIELIGGVIAQSSSLLVDALGTSDMTQGMEALTKKKMSPGLEAAGTLIAAIFMVCLCVGALALSAWNIANDTLPNAVIMAAVGGLAFASNVVAATQLYRNRFGSPDVKNAWITTRNEALGNLCVIGAAAGVYATQTAWPDLLAMIILAPLSLRHAYTLVVRSRRTRTAEVADRQRTQTRSRATKRPPRSGRLSSASHAASTRGSIDREVYREMPMVLGQRITTLIPALVFTLAVPLFGYVFLGPLYAVLFLTGYLGGFLIWLFVPRHVPWSTVKRPYWATMLAFLLLHKVEENRMRFFETVSEQITGTPMPEITASLIIALLIIPIGAWLAIPILIKRGAAFGYFLGWTFFASMGITELAHFGLPLLTEGPYGYFPGMASVVVLAPLAWWGMRRLTAVSNAHGPQSQADATQVD